MSLLTLHRETWMVALYIIHTVMESATVLNVFKKGVGVRPLELWGLMLCLSLSLPYFNQLLFIAKGVRSKQ